jgi:hypothetical protein
MALWGAEWTQRYRDRSKGQNLSAAKLAHVGGRLIAPEACDIGVVTRSVRLLTAALYADEYLGIKTKDRPVWVNLLEPYLAMAEVAV